MSAFTCARCPKTVHFINCTNCSLSSEYAKYNKKKKWLTPQGVPNISWKKPRRCRSYQSECLGLVGCRPPGAGSVDSASSTVSWGRRTLGQQVKGGTTPERLQRSKRAKMKASVPNPSRGKQKSQRRYSGRVAQRRQRVLNRPS